MAATVKIVTDSACDIDPEILQDLGISVVPLTVTFDAESYLDGFEMRGRAFWDKFRRFPGIVRTSQPPVASLTKVFRELTEDGSAVVGVFLSAALSGTWQVARLAASELPDRNIAVINSKTASVGYGLIALEARDLAESGASFEEVRDAAQSMVDRLVTLYAVDTLDYLHKNGRIGRAKHFWGSMLNMKPVLFLDDEGYVSGATRVRGESKVIPALLEQAGSKIPFGSPVRLGMCHGDVAERGDRLVAAAKEHWQVQRTVVTEIGGVIGIHNGPGTLALILLPVSE